jgi:translation initiation factor IF-2
MYLVNPSSFQTARPRQQMPEQRQSQQSGPVGPIQASQGMPQAQQMAQQQRPNLGQSMAQMSQQMPQQMPSMERAAMAARAQMSQQMPQQMAQQQRPNLGQSMAQMGAIYGLPQGQQQMRPQQGSRLQQGTMQQLNSFQAQNAQAQSQQSGPGRGPNNFGFQQRPANPQASQGRQAASMQSRRQFPR